MSHGYTVISIHEIIYHGAVTRLVRLRNPWGEQEWNGEWSRFSQKWNEAVKVELKHSTLKAGEFYMDFADFLKEFEATYICQFVHHFKRTQTYIPARSKKLQIFEFSIPENQAYNTINFVVYQTFDRFVKGRSLLPKENKYNYQRVNFILARVETDPQLKKHYPLRHIHATSGADYQKIVRLKKNLTPGVYYLFLEVKQNETLDNKVTLCSYSSINVDLYDEEYPEGALTSMLRQRAQFQSPRTLFGNPELRESFYCLQINASEGGDYGFFYAKNETKGYSFKLTLNFPSFTNVNLIHEEALTGQINPLGYKGDEPIEINLQP